MNPDSETNRGSRLWPPREQTMAYTVKRVAAMSGISGRTLRFYDQTGLLKPAYTKANGYRIYEEPQLLMLQQILFYRELGFELKGIKQVLSQRHVNPGQDEWICVVEGEVELEIGKKRLHLGARESMFIPRNVEHVWRAVSASGQVLNTYAI